eukprot:TRINITY_DN775_c0_g1_i1.p1 TRINITY_DN775_c0_g1~~TRINITY_DN775_c0_g1_i1.p1  ORF type:complete len:367 (-),score=95.55 TRINITY_DN775_c0_g1_i1:81-1181(-)
MCIRDRYQRRVHGIKNLFKFPLKFLPKKMDSVQINFKILCPLQNVEKVNIVGNLESLGQWQPEQGLSLNQENMESKKWVSLEPIVVGQNQELKFKLCLWQQGNNQVQWEPLPFCDHKIYAKGSEMNLEWEYGSLSIVNNQRSSQQYQQETGGAEKEKEIWELNKKCQSLIKAGEAKEQAQQKEVNELNTSLKNERQNTEAALKKIAVLEEQIKNSSKQSNSESQQTAELNNQLKSLQSEMTTLKKANEDQQKAKDTQIASLKKTNEDEKKAKDTEIEKLKKDNVDQQKLLDEAKQNVLKTSQEIITLKTQIDQHKKEIQDLKAASSTQAPQANEEITKEQTSPANEGTNETEEQGKVSKKKSKKNK